MNGLDELLGKDVVVKLENEERYGRLIAFGDIYLIIEYSKGRTGLEVIMLSAVQYVRTFEEK